MTYQIIPDVYRIDGGYGKGGENFGGILIKDDPSIVIGASGPNFIRELKSLCVQESLGTNFRVYLPAVTIHELEVLPSFVREFSQIPVYVHQDIVAAVQEPRENYFNLKFALNEKEIDRLRKSFPKSIENIHGVSKSNSFQADNTKILVIPFSGPHRGHMFIYSTKQKLLASGIMVKFNPNDETLYYLDNTGNISQFEQGLEFIEQATSEIHFPSYDEPYFLKGNPISTSTVKNSLAATTKNLTQILSKTPKSFEEIVKEYNIHHHMVYSEPFVKTALRETVLLAHLRHLVKNGKAIEADGLFSTK